MKNKKIMILGASVLQLPAIKKAKEMGLTVIAIDRDTNAIGFNYADIALNISTLDIPNVVKAAKLHKIDGIMTLASDLPMRTVAVVTNELNLVGINKQTAINVTNKANMREVLKKHNIPIPNFYKVTTKEEFLSAINKLMDKVIVKPADNSGSRGVTLVEDVENKELVNDAFDYSKRYSNNGDIVVEEFLEGQEVSVETISYGGKNHIIEITDKMTTGAPNFVEMGHTMPSQLPENLKAEVKRVAENAINALGIKNGPSHTEIIVTRNGPKIVEVGARLGGDNITTHLVPLATGIDMVKECIKISLGEAPRINNRISFGAAIRYFNPGKGIINHIQGEDQAANIPGVKEIYFSKKIGDKVTEVKNSVDRVGYVIAQGNNASEAIRICEQALNEIKIVTK